ncbi:hypothetical protein TNCV_949531 [Trichonephila clavipes]|nr:hypothetical protein TNCV_949531 [Trichonephila clavipes]
MDFLSMILQKVLNGMYPLSISVCSIGQKEGYFYKTTEFPDGRVAIMAGNTAVCSVRQWRIVMCLLPPIGTTVTQRTLTNSLFQGQLRASHPVACIPLTPSY